MAPPHRRQPPDPTRRAEALRGGRGRPPTGRYGGRGRGPVRGRGPDLAAGHDGVAPDGNGGLSTGGGSGGDGGGEGRRPGFAAASAGERRLGTVKWFNNSKGLGFITPDDGSCDIFVHQSSIASDGFRSLRAGEHVEFEPFTGGDGRTQAVHVTGPGGAAVVSGCGGRRTSRTANIPDDGTEDLLVHRSSINSDIELSGVNVKGDGGGSYSGGGGGGGEDRKSGTVKWFDRSKGFGFITPEDGTGELFFHQSSVKFNNYSSLGDGHPVEFSVYTGDDGRKKAVNVASSFTYEDGLGVQILSRKGIGIEGTKVAAIVNSLAIEKLQHELHCYKVSMVPFGNATNKIRARIIGTLSQHNFVAQSIFYAYQNVFYSPIKLPQKRTILHTTWGKLPVKVNVIHDGEFAAGLGSFTLDRYGLLAKSSRYLYQRVFKKSFLTNDKFFPFKGFFFSKALMGEMNEYLARYPGFFQSVRPTQSGISLNIDRVTGIFVKPMLLTDFVKCYLNLDTCDYLTKEHTEKIASALNGLSVVVKCNDIPRTYRIQALTADPLETLTLMGEQETTIVDYFLQKYERTLQYVKWPCLTTFKKGVLLPMEVCEIVEGQKISETRKYKGLSETPLMRLEKIQKISEENSYYSDPFVQSFGLRVKKELSNVDSRVLQKPTISCAGGKFCTLDHIDGGWDMKGKILLSPSKVEKWICVDCSGLDWQVIKIFLDQLVMKCRALGMTINEDPLIISCNQNDVQSILHRVKEEHFAECGMGKCQLLTVILPQKGEVYGRVKWLCDHEIGIVCQCVKPRNNTLRSETYYLESIALKINKKLGGLNVKIDNLFPKDTQEDIAMFVGADVQHKDISIAAVVASTDPHGMHYAGKFGEQGRYMELIDNLDSMMRSLLQLFIERNGRKPNRIFYYRDGLSESELQDALQKELKAIKKACSSFDPLYEPKITMIVAVKRHHVRLFSKDTPTDNIRAGTIVDSKLPHPYYYEFYLASHHVLPNKGVSRPVRYIVLHDDNDFSPDEIQKLTYYMCYAYSRSTHPISIVAPVLFAHNLAARAHLYWSCSDRSDDGDKEKLSPNIENTMFFA